MPRPSSLVGQWLGIDTLRTGFGVATDKSDTPSNM